MLEGAFGVVVSGLRARIQEQGSSGGMASFSPPGVLRFGVRVLFGGPYTTDPAIQGQAGVVVPDFLKLPSRVSVFVLYPQGMRLNPRPNPKRAIILGGPFDLVSRVSKVGYGGL